MRIFLVDDDEIIRKGMRKIIESSNLEYTVVGEASDGELALENMKNCEKVDLIITDIRMPIMDGMELIKRIREIDQITKIIVVSGFDDFSYVRNAFMDGAVDYLLKPINKNDFLALLKKISESILQETNDASYRKESHGLVLAKTLNKLFQSTPETVMDDVLNLRKINLDLDAKYAVMISSIDNYYKQKFDRLEYEEKLQQLLLHLEIKFSNRIDYRVLQYINNIDIVSFVFASSTLDAGAISEEFYLELKAGLMDDTSYTMGVSQVFAGIENAPMAYLQATEAVNARFYSGRDHRIEYHTIQDKCIDMNYDVDSKASMLVHYIELCQYANAKQVVEQIFLDMSFLKPNKFKKYIHEIIEILILRVKDFQEALLCYDHEYKFNVEYTNTYNELKAYMNSIMQNATLFIRNEREKRSKKRMEMAKTYIEEHYMEAITLNNVADYIELNASYFSNLFKTEVGINFSEYLLDTRMNKAKILLRNPKIKIYEIGNMVGYEDAVSFGRAFKKKIGMSPKEYRNTVY